MSEPDFTPTLKTLIDGPLQLLAARLVTIAGLSDGEIVSIVEASRTSLEASLHRKLCRVLVIELNRARVNGRLAGATSEERWRDFLGQAAKPGFWLALQPTYPSMKARVDRLIANVCEASFAFAAAWDADRAPLAAILGRQAGRLRSVSFAAGDSHRGGRSVAMVESEGGRLVYKPRSLTPERLLAGLLHAVEQEHGMAHGLAVPRVLDRGEHGWAAFIEHVYAADKAELSAFYRAMGGWLALTRLLGATDLHAENLIAHRGSPVVVDAETLFTPKIAPHPTGLGAASDEAMRLISGTVIATGLLPNRGLGLAWRGVDVSGWAPFRGSSR